LGFCFFGFGFVVSPRWKERLFHHHQEKEGSGGQGNLLFKGHGFFVIDSTHSAVPFPAKRRS
jgi:hypothetical protein